MFIFPVQDFCSVSVFAYIRASSRVFLCAHVFVDKAGESWHYTDSLPVGDISWTEGVTAGDLKG